MEISDKQSLETYLNSNANSTLFSNMAEFYLNEDNPEKAIEICREGLAKYPYSTFGHYIWGLAAIKLHDVEMAVRHFKSVVEMDPGFLEAFYRLVEFGGGLIDITLIEKYVEKILLVNPYDDYIKDQFERVKAGAEFAASSEIEEEEENIFDDEDVSAEVAETPETQELMVEEKDLVAESEPDSAVLPEIEEEQAHLGPAIEREVSEQQETAVEEEVPAAEQIAEEEEIVSEQEVLAEEEIPEAVTEEVIEKEQPEIQEESVETDQEVIAEESEPVPASAVPETETETVEPPSEPVDKQAEAVEAGLPLTEMFSKLRSQSLDDLQREDWFTKASSTETDEKAEVIETKEPVKPEPVAVPEAPKPSEEIAEPPKQKTTKPTAKKTADQDQKVELKIPVPTLTVVDILKKQKLYNQALEILTRLETKSKDIDKVKAVRKEIEELKAKEEAQE